MAGLFLLGCAQPSVMHLARKPWVVNTPQTLEAKFCRFNFESVPLGDAFGVRGAAYPLVGAVPDWAAWVEEFWLAAYLADSTGQVIAKNLQVFLPRPLSRGEGIPFEFILQPEELGRAGPLYITFGYRMVLTEGNPQAGQTAGTGKRPRTFFATEKAVDLF